MRRVQITKVNWFHLSDDGTIHVSGKGDPPAGVHERFHISVNGQVIACRLMSWSYNGLYQTEWDAVDEATLGEQYWVGDGPPRWPEDAWSPRIDRRALVGVAVLLFVICFYLTWQVWR